MKPNQLKPEHDIPARQIGSLLAQILIRSASRVSLHPVIGRMNVVHPKWREKFELYVDRFVSRPRTRPEVGSQPARNSAEQQTFPVSHSSKSHGSETETAES